MAEWSHAIGDSCWEYCSKRLSRRTFKELSKGGMMDYDKDKVDEMALALLYLTHFKDMKDSPYKAWKGLDWDVLDRLHDKNLIYDPKNKNKSIIFTEDGFNLSKQLFQKHFCVRE